jgi:excinuclease ABC subunit B
LLDITESRRVRQQAHNEANGITPQSVVRPVQESLQVEVPDGKTSSSTQFASEDETEYNVPNVIAQLEAQMREASAQLEFELAAHLRDQIKALREKQPPAPVPAVRYQRKKR